MKIKKKFYLIALAPIFLILFLIPISSMASAANISFNPQTIETNMDSSQNIQVVMDKVPDGLAGFNLTISVSDPKIAEITAASSPGWNLIKKHSVSTVPSSSIWIKAIDLNRKVEPGATNVSLGNITLNGTKIGTTNLSIQPNRVNDDNGSAITLTIIQGKINILADNKAPVINSVSLNNSTPNTDDSILVTVMEALRHLQTHIL